MSVKVRHRCNFFLLQLENRFDIHHYLPLKKKLNRFLYIKVILSSIYGSEDRGKRGVHTEPT